MLFFFPRKTLWPVLLLAVFTAPLPVLAQDEAYFNSTVRVSVPGEQEGFGFIVGERNGDLYILTAEHVVSERAPGQAGQVQVYFYQDQAKAVTAEVLMREPEKLDAALLRVAKPRSVNWQPLPACAPPYTEGEEAWFIGRDQRWFLPVKRDRGQINETEPDHLGHLELSIGSVRPGTSGAPVLTERGLVGMMLEDVWNNSARAVEIELLRRFVREQNYPWQFSVCGSVPLSPPVTTTPAPRPVTPTPVLAAPAAPSDGDIELLQ